MGNKTSRRSFIKNAGKAAIVLVSPASLKSFAKSGFMKKSENYEAIIIGGSFAGLSAAMALGRSMRDVLVIDGASPCNAQTPHSHNFITHDGEVPSAILMKAKAEVLNYKTVVVINDIAARGEKSGNIFSITTNAGNIYTAKKLVFATGIKDILPNIAGLTSCWGISVIHCPYCHGYEVRNQKTGILANGDMAFHYAQLINNWTKDLTIFTNGASTLTSAQMEKININGVKVIEKEIDHIEHNNGYVRNLVFKDRTQFDLKAIYTKPAFEQSLQMPLHMGCELTEYGYIMVDSFQKTNIPGVYACGDNSSPMRSIANSVATGSMAGAVLNKELIDEEF